MHSEPSCKEVIPKGFLEILGLLLLITPMAYIYVFASEYEPYHEDSSLLSLLSLWKSFVPGQNLKLVSEDHSQATELHG